VASDTDDARNGAYTEFPPLFRTAQPNDLAARHERSLIYGKWLFPVCEWR
jgi:hypothetical protein